MNDDQILWEILKCRGANKPHYDVDFSRTRCPNCNDFMIADINNDDAKFTDVFNCTNCDHSATRYEMFQQSLNLSDNYDIAESILFTLESSADPTIGLWDRVNKAIDAIVKNGLTEDQAEKIVTDKARCYACGLDNTTEDLYVTFDFTNISPFYMCRHCRWMEGGF